MTQLVTLHVWRVPRAALPRVLWRMAVDRRRLPRTHGVSFGKLLGTGRDLRFGPADGEPTRWAALIAWDDPQAAAAFDASAVGRAWSAVATASCRLSLRPVSGRGAWAGRSPFRFDGAAGALDPAAGVLDPAAGVLDGAAGAMRADDGPVLVLTRARLRLAQAGRFWRTIPGVGAIVPTAPGLLAAFGVGEAPLGWQGTVSVWRSTTDLVGFAYRRPEHRAVVADTPVRRWYAEELFARFTVLDVAGDRTVVGWRERDDQG